MSEALHQTTQTIADGQAILAHGALIGDREGQLDTATFELLRASGGTRLLQAKDLGGFEAHPVDFVNWVMEVATYQPSAGWVAGVVGVHPWEISFMDPTLQGEIFGEDPDTWTASPYAPFGQATPVDGGFLLTGDWPYSTGTDFCDWVIIGGRVVREEPGPPDFRHFVLPRSDYEIVADSWNVMGLKGTGSKNVRCVNAFVPEYRTLEQAKVNEGVYASERRPNVPLYGMMFGVMFPAAIAASTLGIARCYLNAQREYMSTRVSVTGQVAKSDPTYIQAYAVAEADLEAGESHLKQMLCDLFDHVSRGGSITPEQRLRFRRNQTRASDRVFESLAPLARLAGSAGIQEENGLERRWRDLQASITHICNIPETIYYAWGAQSFGADVPPGTMY